MDAITIILAGLDPDDYCDDCGETLDDGDCNSEECNPSEDDDDDDDDYRERYRDAEILGGDR